MPSPVNDWTGTLLRPWHSFVFGGPSARPAATTIEYSMDTISARAQCRFPGDTRTTASLFPAVDVNQHCWIMGGYRDAFSAESNEMLFDGWIEDDGSSYSSSSLANTLSLGDQLRLTQYQAGDPGTDLGTTAPFNIVAVYDGTEAATFDALGNITGTEPSHGNNAPDGGWTDISIVRDLLTIAGIPDVSGIGGLGVTMAQSQAITLTNTQPPSDLISQIDQVTHCKTFATPGGPVRIVTTFTPNSSAAWTLTEGETILQIENKRSIKNFYNRVVVRGIKVGGAQIVSIAEGEANLPPVAGGAALQLPFGRRGGSITNPFSSDLIQSQDHADRLSEAQLTIGNRVERRISVTTNFNPYARPGQTVAIYAPHAKIYATVNTYAFGVKHSFESSGAHTTWDLALYD